MQKKFFTIVEILTVVILISILAALGFGGYYFGVVRSAKISKAKHNISLIVEAEKIHHSEYNNYESDLNNLKNQTGVDFVINDGDWSYSVSGDNIVATNTNTTVKYNLTSGKFE